MFSAFRYTGLLRIYTYRCIIYMLVKLYCIYIYIYTLLIINRFSNIFIV